MGLESRRLAGWLAVLVASAGFGCGHDSPGAGGAVVSGNVSTASAAALRERSSWLARIGEEVFGLARTAHAQTASTALGGITVVVRGGGREVSDLTDDSGNFNVVDAPTGDVLVLFRRSSCEAELPLSGVLSNSTIALGNVSFVCVSSAGTATASSIQEQFSAVIRNDPDTQDDVRTCVRRGGNDTDRHIDMDGATFFGDSGNQVDFGDLQIHDELDVAGTRSAPGETFTFTTSTVHVHRHNVKDDCLNPL